MSPQDSMSKIKVCLMLASGILLFVLSIARAADLEWTEYLRLCAVLWLCADLSAVAVFERPAE